MTALAFALAHGESMVAGWVVEPIPAVLLSAVFVVVAGAGITLGYRTDDRSAAVVVGLGPVVGFLVYLLGYRLGHPPSTDSPTWVSFIAFASGILASSVVGFGVGRFLRSLRSR